MSAEISGSWRADGNNCSLPDPVWASSVDAARLKSGSRASASGSNSVPDTATVSSANGAAIGTFGNDTFTFSGSTLTFVDSQTGERTTVWGDPHITNPNGTEESVDGDFTFNLGNGVQATVVTSDGVQSDGTVQPGVVAQNSYAEKVIITNGQETETLGGNGSATLASGGSSASNGSLELIEIGGEWVARPTTGSASVDAAIAKFQAAANAAAAESINTSTEVTAINGIDNAIKKISPQ